MLPKIIGCEEFPKSDHGKLLIDDIDRFINEQYRMSAKDVLLAFEKAATFTLFLDGKRLDPSTFGKYLSRASVGKVLTAYKESKQGDKARPSGYNYNQLNAAPVKVINPEEAYSLVVKWTKEDGKFPLGAPYRKCYEYLIEKKAIKPINHKSNKRGRLSQMVGSVIEADPYRMAVQEYLQTNI
jgi:hypothetical protein